MAWQMVVRFVRLRIQVGYRVGLIRLNGLELSVHMYVRTPRYFKTGSLRTILKSVIPSTFESRFCVRNM